MGCDDGDDVTSADFIRTYNEPIEWTFMEYILISHAQSPPLSHLLLLHHHLNSFRCQCYSPRY